jgi:membrane protein YdbS with pleckstrin-like domain
MPTTIEQYPLERRKIMKKLLVSMIGWTILFGIFFIIALVFASAVPWGWYLVVLVAGLHFAIFCIDLWYQTEYYKRYFYDIQPDFLSIKKGVITPHQTMLPYEKLQDVYMDQDIFDRIFNLWDVHVSTATAMSGYQAHIDGVNQDNAEKIRSIILDKIRKKGGTDR